MPRDPEHLAEVHGWLQRYAWRFRYPGEPEDPSLDEALQELALAREVFEAILARLPAKTRSTPP